MAKEEGRMEKIVSLAKRRGFVFPGSEIYGGLAGTWDYGDLGVELKQNIKDLWWRMFVKDRENVYRVDAAILMNPKAWEASGHVAGFSDPLVECKKCKRRFRADHIETVSADEAKKGIVGKLLEGAHVVYWKCGYCDTMNASEVRQFNMMFKTHAGAAEDDAAVVYLRPETAGGIFTNFKNTVDAYHPKLPFGIAQIGKAFRNEIAPRDFVFRAREFEQMELEYFVSPDTWTGAFAEWRSVMTAFAGSLGLDMESFHEADIAPDDLAHYSKKTIDFEFDFPFGRSELWGLAYRTDFDLAAHQKASGVSLQYLDEETKEKFVPHVIEPSLGVDRTVLAVLSSAYTEDELGGEKRTYLKLSPRIAPVKAAVFPLLKNKPELVKKAREVYAALKKEVPSVVFDDNGNIGKRYRRQDEIGTPFCLTIDFDTLGEKPELTDTVTLRDRDSGAQERLPIADALRKIREGSGC